MDTSDTDTTHQREQIPQNGATMASKCNYNCDACTRTLCAQGNPTIEPTPEEMEETLAELNAFFFGRPKPTEESDQRAE